MDLITTGFGMRSTAEEVSAGIDLSGKRAIVTGGGSGIGFTTAMTLAARGAEVTITVRNEQTGKKAVADIAGATGNQKLFAEILDLSVRDSIHRFTDKWKGPLHILINNAGVMALPELERTKDGRELQFASNHLGHFELALGLHGALTSAKNARVVCVSSSGHLLSPVVFDDIDFKFRFYEPWVAYGQSKTAVILFAVAANKRWAKDGIVVNSLNPGAIATNLQRHVGGKLRTPVEFQKTVEQGAATSVLLAVSPLLQETGGHYFENCNESPTVTERTADYHGVAMYALDPGNAERLWNTSMEFIHQ